MAQEGKDIQAFVSDYYGKVLSTSKDLKTTACTACCAPPLHIREALKKVPDEIVSKFYGCGSPVPLDIAPGSTVLDLGCGSGRDCYIAATLVGPTGKVIGIDMTDEQLAVARKYADEYCRTQLGYPASVLDFRKGFIECIEDAGVPAGSVDLVISNCVVNLSPDKPAVIRGAAAALREGGELYFSDVYCDRRLPEEVRSHQVLYGECIAGALYVEDFRRIARAAGFQDPRIVEKAPIKVTDPQLKEVVGEAKFWSITFRCFKLSTLETLCEDYGQVAVYRGGIPGSIHAYDLDSEHRFVAGKPALVCGNTADMLQLTRLARFFTVTGDHSKHFGLFPCGPSPSSNQGSTGGGCC